MIKACLALILAGLLMQVGAVGQAAGPAAAPAVPATQSVRVPPGLAKLAREQGRARVIVGLHMAPEIRPEGVLTAQERQAQRWRIQQQQAAVASTLGGFAQATRFQTLPFLALPVTADELAQLASDPRVASLHEDAPLYPQLKESVPLIGATDLHLNGHVGADWAVAVIDDGVYVEHPFIAARVTHQACFFTTDPGFCPVTTRATPPETCESCVHGTQVAGIATGGSDPATTLSGVARGANLIAVRSEFLTSSVIRGIEHVLDLHDQGVKIAAVNMSFGTQTTHASACDDAFPAFSTAVGNLRSRGIAPVAAAGNGGSSTDEVTNETGILAPACLSDVVAVGASTKWDRIADYSSHTDLVDLLAPGSSITSSSWGQAGADYRAASGTSMATPHVAAAFAVLRASNETAGVAALLRVLTETGVHLDTDQSGARLVAKPRIQLEAALAAIQSHNAESPEEDASATDSDSESAGQRSKSGGGSLSPLLLSILLLLPLLLFALRTRQTRSPMEKI